MIRILLVDDQKSIRESLKMILESAPDLQVVGTASDGHTAIEQVSYLNPDVVLIDMEMPGLDGVSATQIISQKFADVKVLVLSMHDDEALIAKSTHAGALGYLLKNTPPQELRAAVRFVQLGYPQYGPGLLDKVISSKEDFLPHGNGYGTREIHEVNELISISDTSDRQLSQEPVSRRIANSHARELPLSHSEQKSSLNGHYRPSQPKSSLAIYGSESVKAEERDASEKDRWKRYIILGAILNICLWTFSIAALKLKRPVYTSAWTLDLPASRSDAFLEVPGVGRAAQNSDSPYSNFMVADPRTNYKDLLEGPEVLAFAADVTKERPEEFGKPRVDVVPNTTLIKIAVNGSSPREARQKAIAFQDAFERKLSALRKQEISQKSQSLKSSLDLASERLKVAQQKLSDYKVRSGLDSGEQLRDLSVNIESLRRQKSETLGQSEESGNQLRQLSGSLGLSPQQAADAFVLQSDAVFQQYLLGYSRTSAALSALESSFSPTHPKVIETIEENQSARQRLLNRGKQLLGREVNDATLKQINVSNGISSESQRSGMFQQIITLKGREEGLKGQAQALDRQIQQLEGMMTGLSNKKSVLVNLERDVQIAEAIFTSTLGKLDLTNSSSSNAYPQVTVRSKPNLPKLPSSPKVVPILMGTFLASVLLSMGLAALWWRDRRWLRLRKERSSGLSDPLPSPQLRPNAVYPSLPGQE
ncbi:response regulator [Altericista sp. CCNU0014]|uniref:response regulator n=1 Tax=Altericista sp. CCNU0014 TaxID=3082949 RepID=UPI00384F250F